MADDQESPIIIKLRQLMMGAPIMGEMANTNIASNVDTSSDTPKNFAQGGTAMPATQFNYDDFKKMVSQDAPYIAASDAQHKQAAEAEPPQMDPKIATGQVPGVPALPGFAPSEDEKLKMAMDEMLKKPQPSQEEQEMAGTAGPNLAQGGVAAPNDNTPHKAPEGPSHKEKIEAVMKALHDKELNLDDGGVLPPPSAGPLPADAPYEDKLGIIARMMGSAGSMLQSPLGKVAQFAADPVGSAASLIAPRVQPTIDAASQIGKAAAPAINSLAGTSIPTPPPAPAAPQVQASSSAPVSTPPPPAPKAEAPAAPAQPATDFNAMFNQDPSKIAPGLNPGDRQALAAGQQEKQHSLGSALAEGLAGIGDAIAARGGVNQDILSKVITLQGDQRREAMDNFDKSREAAVQNFNLKTQMGKNAVDQLAAKDAYGPASPSIIKLLGTMGMQVPQGALNKDLPQYFQAAKLQADQHIAQGEMLLKATKQASDEIDNANKESGLLHMKLSPDEQAKHIKYRTAELMAQAQGMVHVRTSDGQEAYMPAQNVQKAKQMDPGIKVLH